MTQNLASMLHLPVSQLPDGATGYMKQTEEQVLNDLVDETGITIIEADAFLSRLNLTGYQLPQTLNTLEWWKVFNQGPIGSCLGCSDAQTATGVHWLESGQRVEFSKFGHYITVQLMGNMLGRDTGSMPTDALKVAAKIGYCPEVWSEHLEAVYVHNYGEASGIATGAKLCPSYPRDYRSGLQAFRTYLEEVKNPNSKRRKIMALFRMDKYVRISKVDQIVTAKRAGVGFIQQSSLWSASFDAHPTRVDRISGGLHPKHGGHAYQILDITPSGEPVLGNTWGQWGDEGAKTVSVDAEQEILDHKFTLAFLKTDMPLDSSQPPGPRRIPIIGSHF